MAPLSAPGQFVLRLIDLVLRYPQNPDVEREVPPRVAIDVLPGALEHVLGDVPRTPEAPDLGKHEVLYQTRVRALQFVEGPNVAVRDAPLQFFELGWTHG